MCTLDKGTLFLGSEKSCYKDTILFHKSFQIYLSRMLLSASCLLHVTQVLISKKSSEETHVYLIQFTTEERHQKQC